MDDLKPLYNFIQAVDHTAVTLLEGINDIKKAAQADLENKKTDHRRPCMDALMSAPYDFLTLALGFVEWKFDTSMQSLKGGLKISIAVTVASLFALLPVAAESFDKAYWAALTVAFVIDDHVASSLRVGVFRHVLYRDLTHKP